MESGTQLGHYTISSLIGKGGMGEVYQAKDEKLGRQVAIKVLPEEFAQDADRVSRFRREAQLLASLNHPNIAAIHGLEETDGKHFLVLELVEGPTLADRIQQGPIPVEEALKLALQIAEALEAAHEKGVIHRDLKPANIKVAEGGKVKVLDFGLAKAFATDESELNVSNSPTLSMAATQQGLILGTAAYMSPEQARGEKADQRADVWTFGVVLFEMLARRSAFKGQNISDILASVLKVEPEWSNLPGNLHPRIRQLLERCLEKRVKDRYQAIADARVDIQAVLADPAGVFVQPTAEGVGLPKQRMVLWVATAAILAASISGLVVWWLQPNPAQPINRFSHILPEDQVLPIVVRPILDLSPDGSRIVYVSNQQLHLRSMDTFESIAIPGTDDEPSMPFFSPDGQWVGYWSAEELQLKKIAISGGASISLAEAELPFSRPSWGNDGEITWSQTRGIMQVSSDGGIPELLVAADVGGVLSSPQILPDGEWILSGNAVGTGVIVVQSLESGERKELFFGANPIYLPTGHIVYLADGSLLAVPFDLDTLEAVGGPVPLVEGIEGVQYAVSESGSLAYVPGSTAREVRATLAFIDRNGVVERLNVRPAPYVMPSLSPDGSRIAVQTLNLDGTGTIWVYDVSGETQIRQLTQEGNNVRPIWAPDGERVTYASTRDGPRSIYWQSADGRGLPERLTMPEEGSVDAPHSWSPDGNNLAFIRVTGGNTGLATTGGVPRLWVLTLESDADPEQIRDTSTGLSAFSPDGQWIAYTSNSLGTGQIYVEPFPQTGLAHQITQDGGTDPQWSSDGDELFFVRPEGQLVAVDITTDGPFAFGTERPLPIARFSNVVTYRNYDVAPDDQRFLVVLPLDETGEPDRLQINVVTNWFEELKERVPVP